MEFLLLRYYSKKVKVENNMLELENKILNEGMIINNEILKVDSFVNHQVDVKLLDSICEYLVSKFPRVDKIVTIETSGIAYAVGVAQKMGNIPVVFAKKTKSAINDASNVYKTEIKSFTRKICSTVTIDKRYIEEGKTYLIIDDFLAEGNAALGLIDLIHKAKGKVVGVGIVIEKRFQGARAKLKEIGVTVHSAAVIDAFVDNKPVFGED